MYVCPWVCIYHYCTFDTCCGHVHIVGVVRLYYLCCELFLCGWLFALFSFCLLE